MKISFNSDVLKELKRIKQKDPHLYKKIHKQLSRFQVNHKHPSLRTHKLQGNLEKSWSISIEGNLRMVYYTKNTEAVFFLIGNHDEVYRK